MRQVPEILMPWVAQNKIMLLHQQQYMVVPPNTIGSYTTIPPQGYVWILTSFKFSRITDYITGDPVWWTPSEPLWLKYRVQGQIKEYEIKCLSAFVDQWHDVFCVVTRQTPMFFTFGNQTTHTVVGNSISHYLEVDEKIWQDEIMPYLQNRGTV